MKNKRGQEMNISAVIIIVAGLALLVLLVLGLVFAWGPFKNLKENLFGGNNVNIVSQGCNVACSTQSKYDFCTKERELRSPDETLEDITCYELATTSAYEKYGIEECPEISC